MDYQDYRRFLARLRAYRQAVYKMRTRGKIAAAAALLPRLKQLEALAEYNYRIYLNG